MIRKTIVIIWVLLLALKPISKADEGMWLPFMIDDNLHATMKEMGLQLTKEQIFSFNESSLKDAIVHFGGGCTAEMISDQGLLLTNHHCGYGRIQAHSTPENDYLTHGFWAMTREEELPNPGLSVSFLVRVEDVTERITEVLNDQMSWLERETAISNESSKIVSEAIHETHYLANVRSMFAGNEFYLFVYERFTDVRMVGVPPSSIGKYGGDTDNWMWPRHTGDFMLFRVYTGPDGKPADYSSDNIPLKPRHHLPISLRGVKDGDFAMILGYSGSTDRYLTSKGINYRLENEFSLRIDIRRKKLDIIEEAMASSDELRIKYASKQSGISNYWKNFIGMSNALVRHRVADTKRETEEKFMAWVNEDPKRTEEYGDVMNMFDDAYEGFKGFHSHGFYFAEAFRTGPDLINIGYSYRNLANMLSRDPKSDAAKTEIERLRNLISNSYRNYDRSVDQRLFAEMMDVYYKGVPSHLQPEIFNEVTKKFRSDFQRFAQEVYSKSLFATRESLEKFLEKPSAKKLESDWVFRMAVALYEHNDKIQSQTQQYTNLLAQANHLFIRGLREMSPEKSFYPDANSTMRFTYGSVSGYWPADAVYYHYVTTIEGVMEKENPDHHEFVLPDKLKELYEKGDYGIYGTESELIVNFISNNDITGGNSGSPVIDGEGNLIGLAFDGNWEAMSGDILFEHNMQRCINVDARYIVFIIDKYAGAGHLIEEMTIVR
jgi:hypothetical protein